MSTPAESTGEVNLLVFADTDLLQDHFWVSVQEPLGSRLAIPSAANGSLVINALDNLEGSSDLISVRNRGNFLRPFERINELRRDAELEFRAKEQELIARLDETEQRLVALEERKQDPMRPGAHHGAAGRDSALPRRAAAHPARSARGPARAAGEHRAPGDAARGAQRRAGPRCSSGCSAQGRPRLRGGSSMRCGPRKAPAPGRARLSEEGARGRQARGRRPRED